MTAGRVLLLMLVFMGLWLLWSGHYETLPLVFGVIACALTLWLALRMHVIDDEGYPVGRAFAILRYIPWLLWQIWKSNLDVARRIIDPSLPIEPAIARVPARQKTIIGLVVHANSITITPGTISLDVRDGHILVHALSREALAEDEGGEMDRRATQLEGNH